MSKQMIAIVAIHQLKVGGNYVQPGTSLQIEAVEAKRLAELGAATIKERAAAQVAVTGGKTPTGNDEDPDIIDEIVQAIGMLDPESEDDWTKAGLPDVRALETSIGKEITAAQRDEAWALFEATENGEGEGEGEGD